MVLNDDEEEIASAFQSLQQTNTNNEYISDTDQNRNHGSKEEEEEEEEKGQEEDLSQDINSGLSDWGSLMDNSICSDLLLLLLLLFELFIGSRLPLWIPTTSTLMIQVQ